MLVMAARSKARSTGAACYLILLWVRDQTHLAPAFPSPTLRKVREGWGSHIRGGVHEGLGHSSIPMAD